MRLCSCLAIPLAVFLGTPVLPCAQEVHFEVLGQRTWRMGPVDVVGDVNLDGVPELVIGSPGAAISWLPWKAGGSVRLVSGVDGSLIHSEALGPEWHWYGQSVAGIGDFDGDGTPDFVDGTTHSGHLNLDGEAHVWSGRTGLMLASIPSPYFLGEGFGYQVERVGDLDQDGFSEFAVSYQQKHAVLIYSGPKAQLVRLHRTLGRGVQFASLGDLDGDGSPEYAVGGHGRAQVYDGKSGELLYELESGSPYVLDFGVGVAGMGDLTGDGIPDLAVSSTGEGDHVCNGPEAPPGFVLLVSGADGKRFRAIQGSRIVEWAYGCSFWRLEGGEDINGDGIGDLLAFSPFADEVYDPKYGTSIGGMLAVYSGATGTMLWREHPGGLYGAVVGDLDGDGLSEFAHGQDRDYAMGYAAGKVTVYKGFPGDAQRACTANPNSTGNTARLDLEGPISVGNNELHLWVDGGVPGETGMFLYGPEYVMQPFGDGVLCVGPGNLGIRRIGGPVALDAAGTVLTPVDMTVGELGQGPAAWTPGSTWTVQFWYRDAAGASGSNLSDAMIVTLTP